jgi:hypothetical protein
MRKVIASEYMILDGVMEDPVREPTAAVRVFNSGTKTKSKVDELFATLFYLETTL